VSSATEGLADCSAAEFRAVSPADRQWAEDVVTRTYEKLASDPQQRIARESLVGPPAIMELFRHAVLASDRNEFQIVSENTKAYLEELSKSIAFLVSKWYESDLNANQLAMSMVAGHTLEAVRELPGLFDQLKEYLDASLEPLLITAREQQDLDGFLRKPLGAASRPEVQTSELVKIEVDRSFTPTATDEDFAKLVECAVVATIEGRHVRVEVVPPSLDPGAEAQSDPVAIAQYSRALRVKASLRSRIVEAFFSSQVETLWAPYLLSVTDRVSVARAIIAGPQRASTKLDVWRTTPPQLSAPILLSSEEVSSVLTHLEFTTMDHLAIGAGWRAADDLPRSLILSKVMPSILAAIVEGGLTSEQDWPSELLFLMTWHIGS